MLDRAHNLETEKPRKIRIVVPALNEEENIRGILESIAAQNLPCEVVIADNGSTDNTVGEIQACQKEFATKHPEVSVKFVNVPQRGVANARNAGAKAFGNNQSFDYIIFLDADTRIDPGFIDKTVQEMEAKKLDTGACTLQTASDKMVDKILVSTYNQIMAITEKINPSCVGAGLVVKPAVFEAVNGFDPEMRVYEDADFIKKASKVSNFGVLKKAKIHFSMRRLEKEGRVKTVWKYFVNGIYYYLTGKARSGMEYTFGEYKKPPQLPGKKD